MSFNEFAFNSLSLYNFRVDEDTLGQYVQSKMTFGIGAHQVEGFLNMNKLILSGDFKLEAVIDLQQKVSHLVEVKKGVTKTETSMVHCGTINVEINLQSGDSEDEMKRNY